MLSKSSWIRFLITEVKIFKGDENLLANLTFPYKTLTLVRFLCLSHSRDQKFVTSLMQSAIDQHIRFMLHLYAFIINRFVIFKELRSSKPFHNEPFDPPYIIIHYSDNCSKLHSNTSSDTFYNELSTGLLACTCIQWCIQ